MKHGKDFFSDSDDDDIGKIPDLNNIDDILNFGLRPGSSKSKKFNEPPSFKGGTLEEISEQDEADFEADILKMMNDFEEDPISATRKQLVRMAVQEWRHLEKLYKEFGKGCKPERSKVLRYEIESSTTNLIKLQSSLKALPVQRKEETARDNMASLSELLEQYRKEHINASDDIKTLLEAQRARIRQEENGTGA